MKKMILGFILGIVVTTGIGAVAYSIHASDAEYDNSTSNLESTTVQGAIDELVERVNSSGNITLTKIYSGSFNTTVDCTQYPGWESFTTDNFYINNVSQGQIFTQTSGDINGGKPWIYIQKYFTLSYNNTTGILTITNVCGRTNSSGGFNVSGGGTSGDVYLAY